MAADYGIDVSCVSDLDETFRVVEGKRLLAEACVRRLTTPRGMLLDDADYGTDLRELLNDAFTARTMALTVSQIRSELEKDERVVGVKVPIIEYFTSTRTLHLGIEVEGREESLTLVVDISAVSVTLLSVE